MRLLHLSWIRSITLSRSSVRFKSQTGSAVTPQAKKNPLGLLFPALSPFSVRLEPAQELPWLQQRDVLNALAQFPAVTRPCSWVCCGLVGWLVGEGDCHIFCHYLLSKSALNQFCLNLQNCFFTSSLSHLEASVHLIKIFLFILGAQPVTCHAANSIPAHALLFQ